MAPKKSVFFGIVFGLLLLGLTSTAGVAPQVMFEDVASRAGVTFHHRKSGGTRKYLIESMTGGVAMFDFDGDGWLDLYFVNGAELVQRIENVAADRILRVEESSGC